MRFDVLRAFFRQNATTAGLVQDRISTICARMSNRLLYIILWFFPSYCFPCPRATPFCVCLILSKTKLAHVPHNDVKNIGMTESKIIENFSFRSLCAMIHSQMVFSIWFLKNRREQDENSVTIHVILRFRRDCLTFSMTIVVRRLFMHVLHNLRDTSEFYSDFRVRSY
jgi:hypothetical protein